MTLFHITLFHVIKYHDLKLKLIKLLISLGPWSAAQLASIYSSQYCHKSDLLRTRTQVFVISSASLCR